MKSILMILGMLVVFLFNINISSSQTTGDPLATTSVLQYWRMMGIENVAWCETKKDDSGPVVYSIKIIIAKPQQSINRVFIGDQPLPGNEVKIKLTWMCLAEEGPMGEVSSAFKDLYNQLKLSKTNKQMVNVCGTVDESCGVFVFNEAKILGYRFYKNSSGVWQKELLKE
jgi:hypothetical protein